MKSSVCPAEVENSKIVILTIVIWPAENGEQADDEFFPRLHSQFFFNRGNLIANCLWLRAQLSSYLFVAGIFEIESHNIAFSG
jgi:hypothetical protein